MLVLPSMVPLFLHRDEAGDEQGDAPVEVTHGDEQGEGGNANSSGSIVLEHGAKMHQCNNSWMEMHCTSNFRSKDVFDGRLCLIKSVLSALPVHFMSVLQMPKWAIKDMERKCRGFLWKGQEEVHGGHCLVFWRNVGTPVEKGCLGIKDLDLFGQALRLKWMAKSLEQRDRPWTMMGYRLGKDIKDIFNSMAEYVVGDEADTSFWKANWLGGKCIAWRWPVLFSYVGCSRLTVDKALANNRWVRDLQGSLSNEALGEYFQLWEEVQGISLHPTPDSIKWKLTGDGIFSTSSAYDLFCAMKEDCDHGALLWHTKAPSRVRFFMWLVLKGRCLTADNLAKRWWPHDDLCSLCQRVSEDGHHLFVTCNYTYAVWLQMRNWMNVDFAVPGEVSLQISDWCLKERLCCRKSYRGNFDSIFMLICWMVWKECNARIFEHRFKTAVNLAEDIEEFLLWKKAGIIYSGEDRSSYTVS